MEKQIKSVDCEYNLINEPQISKGPGYGVRHRQVFLLFVCVTIICFTSGSMSVVILAMTENSSNDTNIQIFDWDKRIQGVIMGSVYWGDLPVQIPAVILFGKHGAKIFMTFVMIGTGIFTMLTPFSAYTADWKGVCAARAMQGVFLGVCFPSIHMLLGKWAPNCERNRFGNFVYSGVYIGIIATLPLTAVICESRLGWPWVFYILGGSSFMTGILWYLYGASSPAEHPTISEKERMFIETSLEQDSTLRPQKTPWKAIIKSVPVWALIITQVGTNWGFTVMVTETPTFFKKAFGMDLESSGILSTLPYIAAWICTIFTSVVADYLINKRILSLTATRKLANTIGTWGPGFGMILLMFVPAGSIAMAVMAVMIVVGLDGFNSSGYLLNHIDLSPNFAAILVSVGMTTSDALCFLAPMTTGYLVDDLYDPKKWRIVFILASAVYFISNGIFLIFGTAKRQSWDETKQDTLQDTEALTNIDKKTNILL